MFSEASCLVGGKTIKIATGHLAWQADGAVTLTCEGTVVLVTVVADRAPHPGTLDFIPLTVDYREKTSAAGKIPGGFFKREGRPTEKEILTSRLIDRPLRPLFSKGIQNEIQIMASVLSADGQNDPDILCINGASAALMVSGIPFSNPAAAVRVGMLDDEFVINPTLEQLEKSRLDIVVAGIREAVIMVEGAARTVPEATILKAIVAGHQSIVSLIEAQEELRRRVNPPPVELLVLKPREEVLSRLEEIAGEELAVALTIEVKKERGEALEKVKAAAFAQLAAAGPPFASVEEWEFKQAFQAVLKRLMRRMILEKEIRVDGRKLEEIRPLNIETGFLPRTHGSALFSRGETQALVLTTLGTSRDQQRIDGLEGEEKSKRFMLHYNFPPFCTGEASPIRGPKRREIGHGALAERSILPVLPGEEDFPYTIRVVSDILSSNGSSSMASICGGSLSLMDAGVPISASVAGIAMGLLKEGDRTAILTDILGTEDALGDMDFKIAGTREGVTGLQMDIKISGISEEVMGQALSRARDARLRVLDAMDAVLPRPRAEISSYAPKIVSIQIDPDKIGLVIGPKGKNIKAMEKSGVNIEIDDDGWITISSVDLALAQQAKDKIFSMVGDVEVGNTYRGKVVSIKEFGAFVEILPGKDGLLHISELAEHRVKKVEDVLKENDEVMVKVIAVDKMGRIKLSRRQALEEEKEKDKDKDKEDSSRG